jgi:hypothetical protein
MTVNLSLCANQISLFYCEFLEFFIASLSFFFRFLKKPVLTWRLWGETKFT